MTDQPETVVIARNDLLAFCDCGSCAVNRRPFWVSWWQTPDLPEFELHSPWWISGSRPGDGAASICAAVMAAYEDAARETVYRAFDERPDRLDFRFVTAQPAGWSPYCDRFQAADWMRWPA